MQKRNYHLSLLLAIFLGACSKSSSLGKDTLFVALESDKTGLNFSNKLTARPDFNMFKYMYFYNGAGVGAGDFNNDGLTDLFFASNQGQNKLFINKSALHFEDVTKSAKIPDDGGWSTGVSVADVNLDGLLDIYVCRVGNYESLKSKNQLLICKGIDSSGNPFYADEAAAYGLAFSGFSTQSAFLDYDLDGDLDMFLLNHSLRYNSTFAPRSNYEGTTDSLSRDILFRNDNGKFTDVSTSAGIHQSVIGYGLGIVVSDINMDGWPDIYIGNDFHENDYLYINNKKGGFTEEITERTMHTSQFSMGVDAADINNDGWPEIVAADMLPSDPYILRRSLGEDEYNTFQIKLRNGYNHQYARNTLQLNLGNGLFTEAGLYAGIYATDWSWSTLWMDFNNDGLKDLFVSNGIPKRLNDIDYVNYVSNDEIQAKIRAGQMGEKEMALINKFPEIKLPNRFFLNKGNVRFEDAESAIENNNNSFSNGAVYADLDNDGDLDIVVNNIESPAVVYRNTTNDKKQKPAIQIKLKGTASNPNATGAKIVAYSRKSVQVFEKYPVRGFQSSMEVPLLVPAADYDSVILIWPDNSYQHINLGKDSLSRQFVYQKGLPAFNYAAIKKIDSPEQFQFQDISRQYGLSFKHTENVFNEFDREPLIPFMTSREGPALAIADINQDGLDDFFIGSSKWEKSAVFVQLPSGGFKQTEQPALINDSTYEETGACWADFNGDGFKDLAVSSGGMEYYGNSEYLQPRLYLNDGKGNLTRKADAFQHILVTASCILAHDFNMDGNQDLFIGGRAVSFEYGAIPRSYILQNDGNGRFTDVTATISQELEKPGFVKSAVMTDVDNDKDSDLLLALEWGSICVFVNDKGKLYKHDLTNDKGWWNCIVPCDIDQDGDTDFIAGNQGLNSRLKASAKEPVNFYYYDFDDNGKKEQLLTYYINGREIPFAAKADLEKQMPFIKKKYLYAEDFAKASPAEIFGKEKLKKAALYQANYFANALFINKGNLQFEIKTLPWQAQLTSYRDVLVDDVNSDGLPDVLPAGNFYPNNIQMGRYDGEYGSVLVNAGAGEFKHSLLNGVVNKGELRHIKKLTVNGANERYLLCFNNDSIRLYSNNIKIQDNTP
jgi:hypothetical protein